MIQLLEARHLGKTAAGEYLYSYSFVPLIYNVSWLTCWTSLAWAQEYHVPLLQDDPAKPQILSFMVSSNNQQDITSLDIQNLYHH